MALKILLIFPPNWNLGLTRKSLVLYSEFIRQVATVSRPLDFRPLFIQWGAGASQTAVSCHASVYPGNLLQLPLNLQWLPGSFPYQEGSLLNISHTVPTVVNPCVLGVAEGSSRPDGSVSGAWERLQGCPRCSGQSHSGIQAPGCWDGSGGRPGWGCSVYTAAPHSLSLVLLGSNDAVEDAPQGDMLPWKSYVHGLVSLPGKQRSGNGWFGLLGLWEATSSSFLIYLGPLFSLRPCWKAASSRIPLLWDAMAREAKPHNSHRDICTCLF